MSLTTPYFEQFLLADGRTTVFPFGKGFDALSPTFVKCQVFNTDGSVIVPDFTVDMATGSITIVSLTTPDGKVINAPLPDSIVRVYRDVPETQEITVASLKTSTAQQIVNMFNNIVAMIQELQYSDEHFTVRSTLPQRDLTFQLLDEDSHKKLVYWDNDKRQLVVTEYPENEVILSKNVYEFKSVDGNLYYLDGEGWKLGSPNLETFITKVVHDNTLIGDNKNTLLGVNTDVIATKEDLETKQDKLTAGDGISIENNVISNTRTNAEWGKITGDINNQTDLQDALGDAISAHNTATNAHSNIRGVAGGLATLDNNAKVPMSQINDALIGNVSYQGLWNAETNTPFLADPTGGLPSGYKALGYIDFKTDTYIDTGVFIDETDETVEYDIKMTPSRANNFPFGAAGAAAGDNNTGSLFFNSGTIEYFAGDTRGIRLGEVVVDKDYLINIKLDQTTQTITVIENDLRTSQSYTGSIIAPVPIILGGLYYGSASSPTRNFNYAGKIHYFIIRKNGQTVKQYQPAQRISDGVYGFYEQVSGEFVVSSGAAFASGGGEIEIPKGYYYITTVAGDRFGLHFDVGDWIISAGGYWSKVDNTDAVSAVNGMTGNVVLNANDVNAYNKTEIDDKFAEVNAQINTNTEAIADAKDDINDLQTQINTRTRVIIRRWE